MPFDLSKVLFIATGNLLDPIPPALRDRMEIVHLPGYTEQEKIEIGKRFLVPKQMTNHGLKDKHIEITDEAMTELVRSYTHEAGVRNLERELANVMRKVARQVAEGRKRKTVIDPKKLADLLGPQRFEYGELETEDQTGAATGLVVTEVGGDVVAIEVTRMEGKEDFILTGQLGEVMRESARAGLSWTRAHASELGIPREIFEKNTLHIHVPAGAIPKDGPSAGITMATAIVSALTQIPVRKDVAMTGEITLRGRVLPIGGLKSKILAAHLSGAKIVILPRKNEKDLLDIPDEIRKSIKLILVDSMDQVLEAALRRKPKALVAEPPKVVKGTDPLDPEPEPQARVRRSNFPPTDQPPSSSVARACALTGRTSADGSAAAGRAAATSDRRMRAPGMATEYKDYYAVLGVPRTASQAEIKKAFRKLARQHHPDAKPGDTAAERRFKEVNEANEVLGDPDKRKQYDELGANWEAISRARAAAAAPPAAARSPASVARAATSGTSSARPAMPASSPTSFASSSARRPRTARRTDGPAARDATNRRPGVRGDPGRDGPRLLRRRDADPRAAQGRPRRQRPRPAAEAHAEISLDEAYHGTIRVVEVEGKRLEVTIPPGADSGTRIRLTGKAPGGGDLFVVVRLLPDARFTRRGADLDRELPLTLEEALLGAEVRVETLKGSVLLKIPAGTQNGRTFRLTGQGMPRFRATGSRRPVREGKGDPADQPVRRGDGSRPTALRSRQATRSALTPRAPASEADMQLERFTQKAQEAIVAAQATAQRLESPVLDAEHILSALLEPDDGVPAETLRRLGVDLPGFRGELAAILAKRARIQGGSLDARSTRPSRGRVRRGRGEATRRRVRVDRAPAPRHRRGRRRGPGAARATRGRSRGHPPGAPERSRRSARHLAEPGGHLRGAREVRPRPHDRGARRAGSIRSSVATRRSAGSSRCSRGGPRTTRS